MRKGVGIILNEEIKSKLLEVRSKSDRVIHVRTIMMGQTVNIISIYAPQTGCDTEENDEFWKALDETMISIQRKNHLDWWRYKWTHWNSRKHDGNGRNRKSWNGNKKQNELRIVDFS